MANKLKGLKVTSVDLCKRGANQAAHIALAKSADGGAGAWDWIGKAVAFAFDVELTEEMAAQLEAMNKAMAESEESINGDITLGDAERTAKLEKSRGEYRDAVMKLLGGDDPDNDEDEDEDDDDGEPDDTKDVGAAGAGGKAKKKGKEGTKAVEKGQETPKGEATNQDMHPEVKKALGEFAELRKKVEQNELREVAKKYECIGKSVDELTPKLYELKKSGGKNYDEYIALLDQMVGFADKSDIFKEIGSNRSGGAPGSLEQAVADIQKAQPTISRAEAVVKAYELNPNLSEY